MQDHPGTPRQAPGTLCAKADPGFEVSERHVSILAPADLPKSLRPLNLSFFICEMGVILPVRALTWSPELPRGLDVDPGSPTRHWGAFGKTFKPPWLRLQIPSVDQ